MKIRTTSTFFAVGNEYAFFWWGLFAIYCIGYQINKIRIYLLRKKRLAGKTDLTLKPFLPFMGFWHKLDYCIPIPFVTEMFPLKHILGIAFFLLVNLIFLFLAPFSFKTGGYTGVNTVGKFDRRAAFIGMANWGFVFFLAQRNSILVRMSGLTFEELIPFHRIIARIGLAEFFPHFIWRLITGWDRTHTAKGIFFRNTEQTTGTISMFAFLLMFATSFEYIRRHHFEVFYYSHVIFLMVAIIFACWHETTCFAFFIPAVILWIIDRGMRTYNSWCVRSTFVQVTEVAPQTASQEGILRIMFENRLLKYFRPGQYVFTSMVINGKKLWEYANWHPFTISEVFHLSDSNDFKNELYADQPVETITKDYSKEKSNSGTTIPDTSSYSDIGQLRHRASHVSPQDHTTTIASVHVKALGTKTRDVLTAAAAQNSIKVYMDGPYGPQLQYQDYPILCLFATGIGLTPALSIVKDVVDRRSKGVLTVTTNKIYLVWAVRHTDEIHPFMEMFTYWAKKSRDAIEPIELHVDIYVTRLQEGPEIVSGLLGFRVLYGQRPHVKSEMDKIQTVNTNHRVWAHACGSGAFTREVINEAVKHNFDCHNETFEF